MKKIILTLMLAFMAFPAIAQESTDAPEAWLEKAEAEYVCMVNDTKFDTSQIAVEVDGNVYYGCCPMCKDRLTKDASIRMAVDPVSGNNVDKAKAVIGVGADHKAYYFENDENFQKFAHGPMPEAKHADIKTNDHSCEHAGPEGNTPCEGHMDHGKHQGHHKMHHEDHKSEQDKKETPDEAKHKGDGHSH